MNANTVTYFARADVLTHKDFTLSGKFWGVVIYIFDFDIDSYFCILVMAAWNTKNHRETLMNSCLHTVLPFAVIKPRLQHLSKNETSDETDCEKKILNSEIISFYEC